MRYYRLMILSVIVGTNIVATTSSPTVIATEEPCVDVPSSVIPALSYDDDICEEDDLFLDEVQTPPPSPVKIWLQSQGARFFCGVPCMQKLL